MVEKYLRLCPKYYKKSNFYLKSLSKPTPCQWYCEQVVGQQTLSKTIKNLFKEADISGYFTNHSCRRAGTTRMFQGGVNRKIIKELTGHHSDAVDAYAVTSEEQKAEASRIIGQKPSGNDVKTSTISAPLVVATESNDNKGTNFEMPSKDMNVTCSCKCSDSINVKNVGMVVDIIMSKLDQKGKLQLS